MEKTLSIVKPDGVERNLVGEVLRRFESEGMRIAALRMIRMSKEQAEGFYSVHRERPFYSSLTDFMSSGPCVVIVLEGENAVSGVRTIMGATNPEEADEGTIRKDFASGIEKNIVHGSDSPESAAYEIGYFFSRLEIQD